MPENEHPAMIFSALAQTYIDGHRDQSFLEVFGTAKKTSKEIEGAWGRAGKEVKQTVGNTTWSRSLQVLNRNLAVKRSLVGPRGAVGIA